MSTDCGLTCAQLDQDDRPCDRCLYLTWRDLTALPALYQRLGYGEDGAMTPSGVAGGPKLSGTPTAPVPGSLAAMSLRGPANRRDISRHELQAAGRNTEHLADQHGPPPLLDVLTTRVRDVREHLALKRRTNQGTHEQEVQAHVRFLLAQWDRYIRTLPALDDFATGIRQSAHVARVILGDYDAPPELVVGVPCKRCDERTLARQPGSDDVVCTNETCLRVYRPDEFRQWAALYTAPHKAAHPELARRVM